MSEPREPGTALTWRNRPFLDKVYVPYASINEGVAALAAQARKPIGHKLNLPVDLITLTAHSYSVNLSQAMKAVERLTTGLEESLAEQFEGYPTAGGDMLIGAKLQFGETVQDEQT